jgi:hypothetical protein
VSYNTLFISAAHSQQTAHHIAGCESRLSKTINHIKARIIQQSLSPLITRKPALSNPPRPPTGVLLNSACVILRMLHTAGRIYASNPLHATTACTQADGGFGWNMLPDTFKTHQLICHTITRSWKADAHSTRKKGCHGDCSNTQDRLSSSQATVYLANARFCWTRSDQSRCTTCITCVMHCSASLHIANLAHVCTPKTLVQIKPMSLKRPTA